MKKIVLFACLSVASLSLAKPPAGGAEGRPGKSERHERMESNVRMRYVLKISEALELNEADTLKLSDKVKALAEKRRPIREQMGEAMRAVKAASDGDVGAQALVDANVLKVFDLRTQMSMLDKEMYQSLAKDLTPAKKAKLAVALAHLGKGGGKDNDDSDDRRHGR